MPEINPTKKRQYNIVYKLKKKGFKIHTSIKVIVIYFSDIEKLISNPHAIELIKKHNFKVRQNQQYKLFD